MRARIIKFFYTEYNEFILAKDFSIPVMWDAMFNFHFAHTSEEQLLTFKFDLISGINNILMILTNFLSWFIWGATEFSSLFFSKYVCKVIQVLLAITFLPVSMASNKMIKHVITSVTPGMTEAQRASKFLSTLSASKLNRQRT